MALAIFAKKFQRAHFYSVGVSTSTIGNEWSVPQAASQVIVASNHAAVLSHGDLNMLMDDWLVWAFNINFISSPNH